MELVLLKCNRWKTSCEIQEVINEYTEEFYEDKCLDATKIIENMEKGTAPGCNILLDK